MIRADLLIQLCQLETPAGNVGDLLDLAYAGSTEAGPELEKVGVHLVDGNIRLDLNNDALAGLLISPILRAECVRLDLSKSVVTIPVGS